MTYKIKTTDDHTVIVRIADNAFIPCDEANTDYQTFLAWVAAGNTPTEWSPE